MDYQIVFSKRCKDYMHAMNTYPNAMDEEFQIAIEVCELGPNDTFLSIPSGGIPLERYFITNPKQYHPFETNQEFGALIGNPVCSWFSIPVETSSCTKVLSLAALHHSTNEERKRIYAEFFRILAPNGKLIIGDIVKESKQAKWLDEFVNEYNSNGHNGLFWSVDDCKGFEDAGFQVQTVVRDYRWKFSCTEEMVEFSRYLFGLDKADDETIRNGLQTYLEATDTYFDWTLLYFISTKPHNISQADSKASETHQQG